MSSADPSDSPPSAPIPVSDGGERPWAAWRARLVAAIAIPCVLGLTAWQSYSSYRDVLRDSQALALALSRVAEEHFTGTLRGIDHVLTEAVEMTPEDRPVDIAMFRDLMRLRMGQYKFIRSGFVVGANGIVLGGTMEGTSGIGVGDREYFSALATDPTLSLYISLPLQSRAQPVTSVFVSRALRDAAGAFRGLVVVTIDPKLFEDELQTVRPAQGGFATLLRNDGVILSRVPDGARLVGTVVASGPAMTAAATSPSGVIQGRGAVDGAERILAYRRLAGYPLVVVVGMRLEEILASWRADMAMHSAVAVLLSLVMGAMAVFSDRSQAARLRAQQALARSESRYRLLTDRSPLGIIHADAEGRVLYANDRWLDMVGRGAEQVLGRKWCVSLEEEDRPQVVAAWLSMIHDGGVFDAEMRMRGADGTFRWLRGHASLLDGEAGAGAGLVAAFEDITAARWAEQSLRLSEEKFAKAFLGSPDALVISTQASGRYVEVNNAFCRLLGYDRSEFIGSDAITLGVWADPEDRARLVRRAERDGQVEDFEAVMRRKDGSALLALISVQSIMVAEAPCLLFICRDISERRAMEERSQQLLAKLDASNKELEQFAYVASHDLQEPLRMISGFAQLLERRYRGRLDHEADEFIGFLVDGVKRMQVMIRDLLEYSRVERLGEAFVRFPAGEALDEVRHNLMASIQETGARVHIDALPQVLADRSQFVRLLQNLIGNALKYRDPDRVPEIFVSTAMADGKLEFTVADNGIGIEPQYFERIFLVFQRLHTRDRFEGTGIGLAICKKIVERHGGRLWVTSRPGAGSAFHFTLPVGVEPAVAVPD